MNPLHLLIVPEELKSNIPTYQIKRNSLLIVPEGEIINLCYSIQAQHF